MPQGMRVCNSAVVLKGKLYFQGEKSRTETVLKYTPISDQWTELPPPPVKHFAIATLKSELLVVGGVNISTDKKSHKILTFDEQSQNWTQSHPVMLTALTFSTAIGYQDYLIVAGGQISKNAKVANVNVLDIISNKWKTAQPLPNTDHYNAVLTEDTLYLVGGKTKTVLRAHVPTLISGVESGMWETIPNTPYYHSSPVIFGDTLLTVGGSDKPYGGNPITSIQKYDPATNRWTGIGDLPESLTYPHCVIVNSELFIFDESFLTQSVYVFTLILS